jgi:hypothetical protein
VSFHIFIRLPYVYEHIFALCLAVCVGSEFVRSHGLPFFVFGYTDVHGLKRASNASDIGMPARHPNQKYLTGGIHVKEKESNLQ